MTSGTRVLRKALHSRRGDRAQRAWRLTKHPVDERSGSGTRTSSDTITRLALAAADAASLLAALALATAVDSSGAAPNFIYGALTLPAWLLLFKLYGLYDGDAKRINRSTVDEVPNLFHALVVGGLGLWVFTKAVSPDRLALLQGVVFFASAFFLIATTRGAVRGFVLPRVARERVLLVGAGPVAGVLLRKIHSHPEYGLDPVGYLAPNQSAELGALPHLGAGQPDLESACTAYGVSRVIVFASTVGDDGLVDVIRACNELRLKVGVVPNLVEVFGSALENDDLEGLAVLGVTPPVFSRTSRIIKRSMDVLIAGAALAVATPVFIGAALLVKLTSEGPVFFRQERVGRGGARFQMLKFRTMVADAEGQEAKLRVNSSHSAWLLLDEDPRITPVGSYLRRLSIDELPQLLNVIKGDMSLVGPRPMTPEIDQQIEGWGRRRLDLTPGITGLWQVLGRTSIPFEEMLTLDYLYVTNWSLWGDVRLLFRTLPTVFSRRGVN